MICDVRDLPTGTVTLLFTDIEGSTRKGVLSRPQVSSRAFAGNAKYAVELKLRVLRGRRRAGLSLTIALGGDAVPGRGVAGTIWGS